MESKEISKRDNLYRDVFDSMQEGFAVADIIVDGTGKPCDFRFFEINKAFCQMLGHSHKELIGKTFLQLFPDAESGWIKMLRKVVKSRNPVQIEKFSAVLRKWLSIRAFCPENGKVAGLFIDITKDKMLEEALHESQTRLTKAQEIAHLGSWELDLARNRLIWSDEVYRIFGLRHSEDALNYEAFIERVHPEDRALVDAAYSDSVRENRETYEIEHRIVRKDTGEVRYVHEKCEHLRDGNRKIVRSIGMIQDITDRKQSQNALQLALKIRDALSQIFEAFHSTLEYGLVMQRIVEIGSSFMGSESASMALRQEKGWLVSCVHGMPSSTVGMSLTDNEAQHAVLALKKMEPVAVSDAFNDDRFHKQHFRSHQIRAVLVAPLVFLGKAAGAIFFNYHHAPHQFNETEIHFANRISSVASAALANAELFEQRTASENKVRQLNRELEQRVKDRTAEIEAQYKELEELNGIIKQMAGKTMEAIEADRKALSKEIHDSVAGTLAAIKMQLEGRLLTNSKWPALDLMPLEEILVHLTGAIEETRRISMHLRSRTLDDFGLKPALEEQIRYFKQFYPKIKIKTQIGISGEDLNSNIQTVIYRVVQEALNNIGKHSDARSVTLKLTSRQNQILLNLMDDGCGFDPENALSDKPSIMGYGIHSMRERVELCGGRFGIYSQPGKGTEVEVSLPNSDGLI